MSLPRAVKRTIAYAKYFAYKSSQEEIYHWLISSKKYTSTQVSLCCQKTHIQKKVSPISGKKIAYAKKMVNKLSWFPGIKMIALTGSVAVNNAKSQDDIDLLIITKQNTLWLIRPFFLLLLSIFFKRRRRGDLHDRVKDVFCPNLWLDESALKIQDHNLYTAHEVLQVMPLLNKKHTYEKFIKENSWTKKFLANAYHLTSRRLPREASAKWGHSARLPVKIINLLFYLLQRIYMYPHQTTEKISLHSAFLHTIDYSHLK